jgi:hypothetical protein
VTRGSLALLASAWLVSALAPAVPAVAESDGDGLRPAARPAAESAARRFFTDADPHPERCSQPEAEPRLPHDVMAVRDHAFVRIGSHRAAEAVLLADGDQLVLLEASCERPRLVLQIDERDPASWSEADTAAWYRTAGVRLRTLAILGALLDPFAARSAAEALERAADPEAPPLGTSIPIGPGLAAVLTRARIREAPGQGWSLEIELRGESGVDETD